MVSRRCPGSARAGTELFARDFAVSFGVGSGHAASISVVCEAARGGLLGFFGRGGGFGGTGARITQMARQGGLSFSRAYRSLVAVPLSFGSPSTVPFTPCPFTFAPA